MRAGGARKREVYSEKREEPQSGRRDKSVESHVLQDRGPWELTAQREGEEGGQGRQSGGKDTGRRCLGGLASRREVWAGGVDEGEMSS